jgi:hypothetical protein
MTTPLFVRGKGLRAAGNISENQKFVNVKILKIRKMTPSGAGRP